MKIEVIRYGDTLWGNGQAGSRIAGALESAGADVVSTKIGYGQHVSQDFFDREGIDAQVYILTADQVDALPAKTAHKKILVTFWETPTFPERWHGSLAAFDEVWVSTDFNYRVFSPAHPNVSMIRVPYREKTYSPRNDASKRRFLTVFDYASQVERKNPAAVISAFKDAFEEGEAELIVKTRRSELYPAENEALLNMSRSDIVFNPHVLSHDDMMELEMSSDCLVALHRSEGLGLHILDAVACGTPTIATAFSGSVDCMLDPRHMLVPLNHLVQPMGWYRTLSPNDFWGEPSHNAAVKFLRYFSNNIEVCRSNAIELAKPIQKDFSSLRCGEIMVQKIANN